MKQAVIVLGMCSSGTTALTGSLAAAGLELGVVRPVLENRKISLLHASMTYWKEPSVPVVAMAHRQVRDEILAEYPDRFGFKEPLTLFLLGFWREVVEARLVGTFRHPSVVAGRFLKRYGGRREHWERLWCRYNRRLLEMHETEAFPLVCFDRTDAEYRERLLEIAGALGLEPVARFDPAARHAAENWGVGREAMQIYQELRGRETSWAAA